MDDVIDEEQVLKNAEITAWALRFLDNTTAKRRGKTCRSNDNGRDPAKIHWTERVQRNIPEYLQTSGFELTKEEETGILKCKSRIQGYQPT
jgi:hypothetical protein